MNEVSSSAHGRKGRKPSIGLTLSGNTSDRRRPPGARSGERRSIDREPRTDTWEGGDCGSCYIGDGAIATARALVRGARRMPPYGGVRWLEALSGVSSESSEFVTARRALWLEHALVNLHLATKSVPVELSSSCAATGSPIPPQSPPHRRCRPAPSCRPRPRRPSRRTGRRSLPVWRGGVAGSCG